MKKIDAVLPIHRPLKQRLNRIIENVNKGHCVNTTTVIFKRLPDGRQQPFLHPDIVKKFGL